MITKQQTDNSNLLRINGKGRQSALSCCCCPEYPSAFRMRMCS